jgi:uncharacterized OB-fold protein
VSEHPSFLEMDRCPACRTSLLPRNGPCPRCGEGHLEPHRLPPEGLVLAATELLHPPSGWPAPHRLALVEIAEGVRLLGVVEGALPKPGETVLVERDEARYRIRQRTA